MNKIYVIDEPCGKGKTSFAIQMMNNQPDRSYIYCTPFLDEIQRIKNATDIDISEPQFNGGRKIDDFNKLLMSGTNIALTHSTFANSNNETLEYLSEGKYVLIIDEVLDILLNFNDICNDDLTKTDIKLLRKEGFIKFDAYGKVYWIKDSYPTSKYSNVERLAKNGNLYYLDETMLVWQFPAEIFKAFEEVYILTYMFEGSFLKPYFQYHNIDFQLVGLQKSNNGNYYIGEYSSDIAGREKYKQLITICNDSKLNSYKAHSLSKTWFERQTKADIDKLQSKIYNYFRGKMKAKSKDILWTCPKKYKNQLKGKGYNIVRRLSAEERALPKREKERTEKLLSCYAPINARATNDYSDRSVLAYVYNFTQIHM